MIWNNYSGCSSEAVSNTLGENYLTYKYETKNLLNWPIDVERQKFQTKNAQL